MASHPGPPRCTGGDVPLEFSRVYGTNSGAISGRPIYGDANCVSKIRGGQKQTPSGTKIGIQCRKLCLFHYVKATMRFAAELLMNTLKSPALAAWFEGWPRGRGKGWQE